MRNRGFYPMLGAAAILLQSCSPPEPAATQEAATTTTAATSQSFNPRDISGYWDLTDTGRSPDALNSIGNNRPPLTPSGQEQFDQVRTQYGATLLGNGIVVTEAEANDPTAWCDPPGFPRILWMPETEGFRFLQNSDEVFQFIGFHRTWRELWTDGRALSPDAEPRWFGYSTARWENAAFVVDSTGFMAGSWLDQYGSPHSFDLRVEERYRLLDADHLELVMTVTDPATYTAPWVGEPRIYARVETPQSQYNDLAENFCVWSETRRRP